MNFKGIVLWLAGLLIVLGAPYAIFLLVFGPEESDSFDFLLYIGGIYMLFTAIGVITRLVSDRLLQKSFTKDSWEMTRLEGRKKYVTSLGLQIAVSGLIVLFPGILMEFVSGKLYSRNSLITFAVFFALLVFTAIAIPPRIWCAKETRFQNEERSRQDD